MSIHVPDFETFAQAHPDTQFVDVLLPDLLSTPRGKRQMEPGEPVSGNPYRDCAGTPLPTNWYESALAFERSAFVTEYLGGDFQQLFATTRRAELQAFESQITPLEYDWYLMAG